jgi:hypothetical protein
VKTGKGRKTNPYVRDENPELQKVVRGLRSLVKKCAPATKETLNAWGISTFEAPNPSCFYMVGKNHVTLGFHYGTSLRDPGNLLEGTGKNMRHVKLPDAGSLKQNGLRELVRAAARLNGKTPMRGMSGKQKRI